MNSNLARSTSSCPDPKSALRTLDLRFTKIPDQIAVLALTPREEQLVHRLLLHRWTPDAQMFPSIKRLAELMHCTRRTVQRTLRRLESRGLLVSEANYLPVTGQTTNTYHLAGALLAIVTQAVDQVVARPVDDRRPPATPVPGKRDSRNQSNRTTDRKSGYIPAAVDPARYTAGLLGRKYVRT